MPIPLGILAVAGAGAGGVGAFDLLETTVLSTAAATVTFSSLGSYSDYKHLQIRAVVQSTDTGTGAGGLLVRYNNGSTNYAWHSLAGTGSSVQSQGFGSQSSIGFNYLVPSTGTTNAFGACVIDILNFSNASVNKTLRGLYGAITTSDKSIGLESGVRINTSALTSVQVISQSNSFNIGSRFSLYGIK